MLGTKCQLTIGTLSLQESLNFYNILGFRAIASGSHPYQWCKITDDSLLILLYENGNNYLGLTYFDDKIERPQEVVTDLNIPLVQNAPKEKIFITKEDLIVTLSQSDQTGDMINVVLAAEEYLSGAAKDFPIKNEVLGTFGELGINVTSVKQSKDYWEDLGYHEIHFNEKPYRRTLMTDGLFNIGLHENLKFVPQCIIYYTDNISNCRENLKKLDIPFEEEHFHFWNESFPLHLRTPEEQHIYIAQL